MRWYQHQYHTPSTLKLVFLTIPQLPKLCHPPIAAVTALIFFLLLGSERRAVISNLRHIRRPGKRHLWWKAYKLFYSFCDFVVSYCYVPRADHSQLLAMLTDPDRGAEKIDNCLQLGKGLIVWTAHLGNWEFASRLLEMHGTKVNVARLVERDKPAEVMLRDMMTNERLNIVELNEGVPGSIKLLEALRNNEIVAIQGDRFYRGYHAAVPFFGKPVMFPLGPFLLSHLAGAPILPGFVVREKWLRYKVIMGEPIYVQETEDRELYSLSAARQAVAFLEDNVRTYDDQWLNFFDFWAAQGASDRGDRNRIDHG